MNDPSADIANPSKTQPTRLPVIAVFDIGKTNKKFFLFDSLYKTVHESVVRFDEIKDEDGEPCDDVLRLSQWVKQTFAECCSNSLYDVRAVNFSAYGASFVHLDVNGNTVTPLYNYLKSFPPDLQQQLYDSYGEEQQVSLETASPVLGSLNSGMQLYRIKKEQPASYERIAYSLHLPQYISWLITGLPCAEMTSIGCHTLLWHFRNRMYHDWVYDEGLDGKFPSVLRSDTALDIGSDGKTIKSGIGLHDSSAALIPYLLFFQEPFVLISTGTWCISLHPFNDTPLSAQQLEQDCLCYLDYSGKAVKAARLFAGHAHEAQVKRLSEHFNTAPDAYRHIAFDAIQYGLMKENDPGGNPAIFAFEQRDLSAFKTYTGAYHQLMYDIIRRQQISTSLVLSGAPVQKIFVDGGFAQNGLYMHMLARAFPEMKVFAASVCQATALGAALAIHASWNRNLLPDDLITLQHYPS